MSYQSDVMCEMHRRISSAISEIRKIGINAHFIDEVSLEMQLISDIENMMERISDSVYEKIRSSDGDRNE